MKTTNKTENVINCKVQQHTTIEQ